MGKSRKVRAHNEGFHNIRRSGMIAKEAIERIRVLSDLGMGSKKIAKVMGISRNTVRKYLSYVHEQCCPPATACRPSKLDPHREQIHSWFLSCRGHCPVVHRKLREELNIDIGLRQLQKYCQQWRKKELLAKEITDRYEVPPGDEMQIDFGFDDVLISETKTRICIFVAVLSYSRRVFAKVYPMENQAAWFDGIESAFRYFNGIPVAVVSDNTRCLVDGRSEQGRTIFNRRYLQLARYWQFVPVNCKPYRAKTKGKVERMVGYIKTSCLSGLEADDLSDVQRQINEWMLKVADLRKIDGLQGTPIERYQLEVLSLKPYMGPNLTQLRLETRKVDVSGCIQIDGVQYRVPATDAGTAVDVVIEQETITVLLEGQCITKLDRTADAFEASTFRHKRKEIWEPNAISSSSLDRSLQYYDRFVEEHSNGQC